MSARHAIFAFLLPVTAMAAVTCTYPRPKPFVSPTEIRTVQAGFLPQAPVIDGALNDAEWKTAATLNGFVWLRRLGNVKLQAFANQQIEKQSRIPVTQTTRAFVGYDHESLYVAFDCREDRMDELRAQEPDLSNFIWQDDCVEIMLQPDSLGGDAYWHLIISAANSAMSSMSHGKDSSPREISFSHAVKRDADGWTVEVRLPFTSMGVQEPAQGSTWRANFCREEQPFQEISSWSETLVSFNEPEHFGRLYFGDGHRPEITAVNWDSPSWGGNRLTAELFNPADTPQDAKLELRLNGDAIAQKDCALPPHAVVTVQLDYALERPEGTLELSVGGENRRLSIAQRPMEGQLDAVEWLNPIKSVTGKLTLPVGNRAVDGIRLVWQLDGKTFHTTDAPQGRVILFKATPPHLDIGDHKLCILLMHNDLDKNRLELPFAILPGPFDEF